MGRELHVVVSLSEELGGSLVVGDERRAASFWSVQLNHGNCRLTPSASSGDGGDSRLQPGHPSPEAGCHVVSARGLGCNAAGAEQMVPMGVETTEGLSGGATGAAG